ncbi:MAG TPA: TIM-barrel domain-containing protein [Oceanobacillus sp.]|nr:TIM-barrel domain-containing protein [Oceanobacillus sp.]
MARKTDPLRQYAEIGGKRLVDAIKRVEKINSSYSKRYRPKKRGNPAWQSPGGVIAVQPYERGIHLTCERGWIELHWIAPDCVRVRLRLIDADFIPPFSYAVHKVDWSRVSFEFSEDAHILTMRSSALVCRVDKRRFRLRFELPDGQVIMMESGGIQWRETGEVRLTLAMRPNEGCYGLGMRASRLNLRGKRLQFWNVNPAIVEPDADPLSMNVPFYLGVNDQLAYGIFWDNPSRGYVDLGAASENELTFESESGELRYYLFGGGTIQSVLSRYTELTGRTYLPARWQLGHQSANAEELRELNIPCDALYLNAPPKPGAQLLNAEELLTLKRTLSELHAQSFRAIAVLTPGIPEQAANAELVLKYPDGKPALGVQWGGTCAFVDFSNPAARSWWAEQIKTLLDAGVDGFALDLAGPGVFTSSGKADALPDAVMHANDGITGNHPESRNTYALLMARATHDAIAKFAPERRGGCTGNVGFSGIALYSGVWIDNLAAEWDSLRLCISMALNLSLSGIALVGVDVNIADGDAELYARWLQAVCLFPLLRTSRLGDAAVLRESLQLRYRLLPFLYGLVAQNREYGLPILRPLLMAEPDNPAFRSADDSYLLGESLLVAPILHKGMTVRTIYLPAGTWYDFWSHELHVGGKTISVAAAQDRLPMFVRAGTTLPLWSEMPRAGSHPTELLLRVYPGEAETILYEDSGDGLDYTQGDYRWVYLTCRWEDDVHFVISRRVAGRYSPTFRNIRVEVVGFEVEPLEVKVDRRGAPIWFYDDGVVEITADDSFSQIEITRQPKPDDDTVSHRGRP